MAKGKTIHQRLNAIPHWLLLSLFLISLTTSVFSLRHNNLEMVKLRNAVYQADKDNANVDGALNNLRNYVYAHMNTNLSAGTSIKPPIQLAYTYDRLTASAQQSGTNTGLYTAAENYCQAQIPASVSISGRGRISCVQDYILSHGGGQAPNIPKALYEFDFASPAWSPDLAGWSLLVSAVLFLLLLYKFLSDRFLKAYFKSREL